MGLVKQDQPPADEVLEDGEESVDETSSGAEINRQPTLLEGATVQITDGEYAGRMAVVLDHVFDGTEEYLKFHTAGHPLRAFAKVKEYILRTRDAKNEYISVPAEQVKPLSTTEGWGRGQS